MQLIGFSFTSIRRFNNINLLSIFEKCIYFQFRYVFLMRIYFFLSVQFTILYSTSYSLFKTSTYEYTDVLVTYVYFYAAISVTYKDYDLKLNWTFFFFRNYIIIALLFANYKCNDERIFFNFTPIHHKSTSDLLIYWIRPENDILNINK